MFADLVTDLLRFGYPATYPASKTTDRQGEQP